MDEAELERYIKTKSNGKNILAIHIILSVLDLEVASRKRLWQDVFVYIRKNYRNLNSFPDPKLRMNERRLREKFDQDLLSLIKDGVVIEREGMDEFMIGLNSPVTDFDIDDHPLGQLCWNELDVEPKYSEDKNGNLIDPKTGEVYERVVVQPQKLYEFEKKLRDEVSSEAGDKSESKEKSKPSLTRSVEKIIHDAEGVEVTNEMIAHNTVRTVEMNLRKFVEDVLSPYGNWWKERAPKDVRTRVHDLMEKKENRRARSDIQLEPIQAFLNDTDLGQLIDIIRANRKEFDVAFKDKNLERINPFLTGLKERRDIISHIDVTIPIDKDFLESLDFLSTYVMKQAEIYYQNTSSD